MSGVEQANEAILCATGTVGAAAIGFAFGRSKDPNAKRPISHKRRASDRPFLDSYPSTGLYPITPLVRPHSVSALATDFRKSDGSGQYLRSTLAINGETNHPGSSTVDGDGSSTAATQTTDSSAADPNRNGNQRPSWLRRMSTMSSFHYESPVSTPRPDSSSFSLSNGSTGPILATNSNFDTITVPRNKLVKRTTSQRALPRDRPAHSTLRRPATSHQRSATLMQQNLTDDALQYYSPMQSKSSSNPFSRSQLPSDATVAGWRPFFKARSTKEIKEGSSRKRNAAGKVSKHDSVRCVNPQVDELPTLLLATSITPSYSDDTSNESAPVDTVRPFTPVRLDTSITASTRRNFDAEPVVRPLFSLSDVFPSSLSTWKIARSGSLRRSKKSDGLINGRRISSAPQITKSQHEPLQGQHETLSRPCTTTAEYVANTRVSPNPQNEAVDAGRSASISPLPPVRQSSASKLDLPGNSNPYVSNGRSDMSPLSQPNSAYASPRLTSPPGATTSRIKSDRQSSARSDLASTLVGYDTDNSRFLTGDDEDIDYRSETAFDSTRTGGTNNSQSNVRGPRIDTIFQESPPSDLRKTKLLALQDLLSSGAFTNSDAQSYGIAEEEENVSTPVRTIASSKNGLDQPTPVIAARQSPWSPDDSSTPISYTVNLSTSNQRQVTPDLQDDEEWSFNDMEDHSQTRMAQFFNSVDPISSTRRDATLSTDASTSENQGHHDLGDLTQDPHPVVDIDFFNGPRPQIIQGRSSQDRRNSRASGRRGPSALHTRSQSVPIPPDPSGHRNYTSTSKLESWVLGSKGVSEDWDNDFDFEEHGQSNTYESIKQASVRPSNTSGMLVPRSIMDRQASVHGQFGQVKELTLLVEDLKRLRQQASTQGILHGQSAELWKEAEGIVNLATLDDEDQEFLDPRSPRSPSLDLDPFEEDSLAGPSRRRSGFSPPKEHRNSGVDYVASSPHVSLSDTPPTSRPRKESAAKVKSVLETIHKRRPNFELTLMDEDTPQKKLPFDTTSLRDLVTRAGVVTRALKEIVRRTESVPATPEPEMSVPRDPLFSQIFHQPSNSPSFSKTHRVSLTANSPDLVGRKSPSNDNEVNGHRKVMAVV